MTLWRIDHEFLQRGRGEGVSFRGGEGVFFFLTLFGYPPHTADTTTTTLNILQYSDRAKAYIMHDKKFFWLLNWLKRVHEKGRGALGNTYLPLKCSIWGEIQLVLNTINGFKKKDHTLKTMSWFLSIQLFVYLTYAKIKKKKCSIIK